MTQFINEDKVQVTNIETAGFKTAIRGMRNPMNSWSKSDSYTDENGIFILGENDKDLAQRLINAGKEHGKLLRQIYIGFDVNFPRYIYSELDTYNHAPRNSCSTMHKLLQKNNPITLDEFIYHPRDEEILLEIIEHLNVLRVLYFNPATKDKNEILRRAKALLPEGFLQKRTIATNYEVLRNIYYQRVYHPHRLPEWKVFGNVVEQLPYSDELITYGLKN